MKRLFFTLFLALTLFSGCISDTVSSSASDQPVFAADTLYFGSLLAGELSPTVRIAVRNPSDRIIRIGSITVRGEGSDAVRLNVDGIAGREFTDVEIRPNDSIFVFASLLPAESGMDAPVRLLCHLDFVTLGVTRSLPLMADVQDVVRLRGVTLTSDARFSAGKPYQIFDSLVVSEGAALTLEPGCRLLFHGQNASLKVYGTLKSLGNPDRPVELTADRSGYVVSDIPYELMPGQWDGITFCNGSHDNELLFTSVRNTVSGVVAESAAGSPALTVVGSQLRNSRGYALTLRHTDSFVASTEIADAALGVVLLEGGSHRFNHCTVANYYLFSLPFGPALQFQGLDESGEMRAEFTNTIIYGMGADLGRSDFTGTGIVFSNCLFKSSGTDDSSFHNSLWAVDPMFYTEREDYIFDYHLRPGSPAISSADPALTLPQSSKTPDGVSRSAAPSIGAYEPR